MSRFCVISFYKIDILPLTRANQTQNFIGFRAIVGKTLSINYHKN